MTGTTVETEPAPARQTPTAEEHLRKAIDLLRKKKSPRSAKFYTSIATSLESILGRLEG